MHTHINALSNAHCKKGVCMQQGCVTSPKKHRAVEGAIDEYSRLDYKMIFEEVSGYSTVEFLKGMLAYFSFAIACIQTNNGSEFTKRFLSMNKPGSFDRV